MICQANVCMDLNQIMFQQNSAKVGLLFFVMKHCDQNGKKIPNAN